MINLEESDGLNPSPPAQEGTEETPKGEERGLVRKQKKGRRNCPLSVGISSRSSWRESSTLDY